MTHLLRTPEFKVGILVVVVSGLIGAMSLKVNESSGFLGGKKLWFTLDNAAGLIKNGPVHVAGIRMGVVQKIGLSDDGQARIDVVVQPGVKLTKSSKVSIRANGILGDKHIEIIPGNPADPELQSGDRIEGVEDGGSIDKIMSQVSKITKSLVVVSDNLAAATEGDDSKPLGKIIKNVENLTGDLAQILKENKGNVTEIITTMKGVMARLDKAMVNIDEISTKINEGKGTIGRLINDEEMVDQLDTTLTTFGNIADVVNKVEVNIEGHSNYISRIDETRTYLGINLRPGPDRFYEAALVATPVGPNDEKTTTTVVNGGAPTVTNEKVIHETKYRFTALFGKNFYNFGVKAGVIESEGGVGLEYYALRKRLKVGVDAFDFDDFKLRPYARFTVVKGVFVQVGGEDVTDSQNSSLFLGGGVFLSSDDLKALISRVNL